MKKYLSNDQRVALQGEYTAQKLSSVLGKRLTDMYGVSLGYLKAISEVFYGPLPDDLSTPGREVLSAPDRERCIIALLASRGGGYTLAVHVYVALMLNITVEEIAHIILLAAVYTGSDNLPNGLITEIKALKTLAKVAGQTNKGPEAVIAALLEAFNVE